MKIKLHEIPVREVFDGYVNNAESGVVGYHGKLNIRPAFQREFIYDKEERDEVITTVLKNFPLNVMYWVKSDTGYELLDGQQRTVSICEYLDGQFSYKNQFYHSLSETDKEQLLNYKLMIYICEGTDKEKLDWFRIINIAGEKLTKQELRNAVYTGTWLTSAKEYFSKTNCTAWKTAKEYMSGVPIRQDYLETVLSWLADRDDTNIEEYMSKHQHDADAHKEWLYFQSVINWVQTIFPTYRSNMKGIQWGLLYNRYKDNNYAPAEIEMLVQKLTADDDVNAKRGIYEYVLDGNEKHLSIRSFTESQKRAAYEKQQGICNKCHEHYEFEEMEGDHIVPWSEGGHTVPENLQMLCKSCNRAKSNK